MTRRIFPGATLVLALAAGGPLGAQQDVAGGDLTPPGYGVLNQDQVSVRFTTGDIEIRFLPLDERVTRLVAADGYAALQGLVASRQGAIDSAAQDAGVAQPGLALVTFFARRGDARFDPENLNLLYRNQLYRPAAIVPVTGNFSGRQLAVRTQASAIYLFDIPIPVFESFDLSYAGITSSGWSDVLRRLDRARSQALARWQSDRARDSTSKPR